jgi:glutathione S-transferase
MHHITLWGRASSSNVQKVMWALDEVGQRYQRIDAGMHFGVNKTPDYLAMNPTGLIPTYQEFDSPAALRAGQASFTLWESNAIVRYIGGRYGLGTIMPEDLRVRADADRWMDWATNVYVAAIGPTFLQLYRVPKAEQDLSVIPASRERTIAATALLDRHLASRPWMAGDAFSMADIAMGVYTRRWFGLDALFAPEHGGDGKRPSMPNLEAWNTRLLERQSYQKHIAGPIV